MSAHTYQPTSNTYNADFPSAPPETHLRAGVEKIGEALVLRRRHRNPTKDKRKSFDVPAIDNEKLVLLIHLGLSISDDSDLHKVKRIGEVEVLGPSGVSYGVSLFECGGERFRVAHAGSGIEADMNRIFNSSLWSIKKL
jgi:hypothetical protein